MFACFSGLLHAWYLKFVTPEKELQPPREGLEGLSANQQTRNRAWLLNLSRGTAFGIENQGTPREVTLARPRRPPLSLLPV